jgi:hypothetical protein
MGPIGAGVVLIHLIPNNTREANSGPAKPTAVSSARVWKPNPCMSAALPRRGAHYGSSRLKAKFPVSTMSFCIPRPQELVISEVDNPFGNGMKMAPESPPRTISAGSPPSQFCSNMVLTDAQDDATVTNPKFPLVRLA